MEAHTDDQIRAEFRKRRTIQFGLVALAVVALVLVLADVGLTGEGTASVLTAISAVVVVLVLVASLINWRCPACKRYLGRGFVPKFCRHCGASLS